jgi:hypothetical protein
MVQIVTGNLVEVSSAVRIEIFNGVYSGTNVYPTTKRLTDDNYFTVYNESSLHENLNPNDNYFQTKEITNELYDYLHTDSVKSAIMEKNAFQERYNNNNDVYIHIRLTDIAKHNPGITYYKNAIQQIEFDHLFISTDDRRHSIIQQLLQLYPSNQSNS